MSLIFKTFLIGSLLVSLLILGCALLEQDARRATLVAEGKFGASAIVSRTVQIPEGVTQLVVAVPNYRCSPIADGEIEISIRSNKRTILAQRVKFAELTWSYGGDSCDAYGYPKPLQNEGSSEARPERMRVLISSDDNPVTVEVRLSAPISYSQREVAVWATYGGRVPTRDLFEYSK
jgi:hypothetical protein